MELPLKSQEPAYTDYRMVISYLEGSAADGEGVVVRASEAFDEDRDGNLFFLLSQREGIKGRKIAIAVEGDEQARWKEYVNNYGGTPLFIPRDQLESAFG